MKKKAAKKAVKPSGKPPAIKGTPKPPDKKAPKKAAQAKATAKATATALNDQQLRELDHLHAIQKMNVKVTELNVSYDIAKGEASIAKKALDEASGALSLMISQGPPKPNPQKTLPFKDDGGTAAAAAQKTGTPAGPDPDAWKAVPIQDVLKPTGKQLEILHGAGIKTVGQFEHVRAEKDRDYPRGLASIKGVGGETITKWENAMIDWVQLYFKNAQAKPEAKPATSDAKGGKAEPKPATSDATSTKPKDKAPEEWQLIPIEKAVKLTNLQVASLAELGVATLGTMHLVLCGKSKEFPDRLESLKLPPKTTAALREDLLKLFKEMNVDVDLPKA